jgi:hypothetical protein
MAGREYSLRHSNNSIHVKNSLVFVGECAPFKTRTRCGFDGQSEFHLSRFAALLKEFSHPCAVCCELSQRRVAVGLLKKSEGPAEDCRAAT